MTSLTEENIIVTFCYPASTKHLKKFIFSINSQKYKKFNLIFFTNNYSIENKYLNKITNKYLIYKLNGSPSLVRQMAIKKIYTLPPPRPHPPPAPCSLPPPHSTSCLLPPPSRSPPPALPPPPPPPPLSSSSINISSSSNNKKENKKYN